MDAPGEKLLIRLWETAEKAGIGFVRPWLIRREGRARAAAEYQSKMALGQAALDLKEMEAGRAYYDVGQGKLLATKQLPTLPEMPRLPNPNDGVRSISEVGIPRLGSAYDFTASTLQRSAVRELKRAINLERILQDAEAETNSIADDQVADGEVHPDWASRWRNGAQDVTDEDIAKLWGQILAREVRQPGRYSLRTLAFLETLSKADAESIQKIGPFLLGPFVYRAPELLKERGIPFGFLSHLQSLGLIEGVDALGQAWHVAPKANGDPESFGIAGGGIGIIISNITKPIAIPCYPLTKLGTQVLSLGTFRGDRDYALAAAKEIAIDGVRTIVGSPIFQGAGFTLVPIASFPTESEKAKPAP